VGADACRSLHRADRPAGRPGPDLETSARTVPESQRPEAFELLATAYQACSAALAKIGEPDAAWIAADRAMAAAERAGNPMLVAAGAFRLVFVFIAARHYDEAEETALGTCLTSRPPSLPPHRGMTVQKPGR
jgi:hypothetical protein